MPGNRAGFQTFACKPEPFPEAITEKLLELTILAVAQGIHRQHTVEALLPHVDPRRPVKVNGPKYEVSTRFSISPDNILSPEMSIRMSG